MHACQYSNRNRGGGGLSNVDNALWRPLPAATASTLVAPSGTSIETASFGPECFGLYLDDPAEMDAHFKGRNFEKHL